MAGVWEVSEKELGRLFRRIELNRPKALVRGIVSASLLGAEIIAKAAPKDMGNLKRSVRAVPQSTGSYILVDAPHAGMVEMGSRPHWVPLRVLLEWARRHGATTPAEAYRMARAIQIKIARHGTAPRYYMRRNIPTLRKILKQEVEHEMAKPDDPYGR